MSRPPVASRATSSESVATWSGLGRACLHLSIYLSSHGGVASRHRHAVWAGLEVSRRAPAARAR